MDRLVISQKKISVVAMLALTLLVIVLEVGTSASDGFAWIAAFIAAVCFVLSDFMSRKYILSKDGMNVRWFFHTDFYSWDSFRVIDIEPSVEDHDNLIVCFDRGISRINSSIDLVLHPFKFFAFEFSDCFLHPAFAGIALPAVSKGDFLKFLEGKSITVKNIDLLK